VEAQVTEPVKTPVVFVHGLWMHATSWGPWVELFNERGYASVAPGWPGDSETVEATRANPGALNNRGIAEITDHYAQIIAALPAKPVLIGHSFGGLIVERLLGQGHGRGAVAISPAQFKGILGLPLPQLESAFPILSHPGLRKKTWSHTKDSYAKSFANGVSRSESDEIFDRYTIPGPARVLFQAATANFSPKTEAAVDTHTSRGPLLITGATLDRTVPPATARGAYKIQRKNSGVTEFKLFQGKSHSYPADSGWREVADAALDFLQRYGLGAGPTPAA
jgi:non-heme chloroperoxidase